VCREKLFQPRPTLRFAPEMERCRQCAGELQVHKTRLLTLITLEMGTVRVRETVLHCRRCELDYGSDELRKLKPLGSRFGYDVLVYVGKSMFLRCRGAKEIREELQARQVRISESEIVYLARKFVVYLSLAHRQKQGKIKQLLDRRGGYVLHLDATCEGDSLHLMSGMDGITEIVLENVKLASEKAQRIVPMLRRIKARYGDPRALVHDMGKGICAAAALVFPHTPDFICHYHFLADVGTDLFGKENETIRKRLSEHGVQGKLRKRLRELNGIVEENPPLLESLVSSLEEQRLGDDVPALMPAMVCYTLLQWALAAKKEGRGYGFPFDRPYLLFYKRLQTLRPALERLNRATLGRQNKRNGAYSKVLRDLRETMDDATLRKAAKEMEEKAAVFDKLRHAMRIALPAGCHGLNDRGSNERISTIEGRVTHFRRWLCDDRTLSQQQGYQNMIAQLDKYWDKLFCDPIVIDTPNGTVVVQPQRTNNIIEQFFRSLKRIFRKKSGANSLARTMKTMIADTPLIKNLANPEYLNIILDGRASLEESFAAIDIQLVRKELRDLQCTAGRMPSKIRKIIKAPDLPETLVALFAS